MRVLVVDAEKESQRTAATALVAAGVDVVWSTSGCAGLVRFGRDEPDVVLISSALPDLDAALVVGTIREQAPVPVLLGVGPGEAEALGRALLAGASGAVSRPYDPDQVVQRLDQVAPSMLTARRLSLGPVELDAAARVVRVDGAELEGLPRKEFDLLRVLLQRADQVVTTGQVRAALWPEAGSAPSSNAVAVHAARLRQRLDGRLALRTVRGVGYRLTRPD